MEFFGVIDQRFRTMGSGVLGALVLVVAILTPGLAATPLDESTVTELHRRIIAVHEKQKNVGVAVSVWRGGAEAYSEQLGHADTEHEVDVVAETRFGIASITKLFTAIAVLQLHAEGRIDFDAPIQTYVPDFPVKPQGTISIRMLLTHRSGLPHPRNRTPKLYATHFETANDAVSFFADDTLLFAPDSSAQYSSSNYNLLAAAVEGITGLRFTEVVQQSILNPLLLRETGFDDIRRPMKHRARRYSFYEPWSYAESDTLFAVPLWDYSFNVGGGNMFSTARDLARFGEALFDPGLLPARELALLMEWFGDTDDQGRPIIFVSGANQGLQAGLAILPDQRVSAAVLSNTWGKGSRSGDMVKLARSLAEVCIMERTGRPR